MPVQTHFDFRHPTRIVHGPGSIACLADCFSPADKVLIVSDQVLGEIGTVEADHRRSRRHPPRRLSQRRFE